MNFREWLKQEELNEVSTSTSSVAGFQRPVFEPVRRRYPKNILFDKESDEKQGKGWPNS